jgi:hypothetical protein
MKGLKKVNHKCGIKLLDGISRGTRHVGREYGLCEGHRRRSVILFDPHQDFRATLELGHDGATTRMHSHIFVCHSLKNNNFDQK